MHVEYFSAPLGLTGLAVLWRLVEDFFLVPKGSTCILAQSVRYSVVNVCVCPCVH